ncbi:MAG TPA: DUF5777 family beta-barrel protein [Holophagaceae bacterium]|nr:DUF5777 family beta-barrel protein [Holophagaceae bacterium]
MNRSLRPAVLAALLALPAAAQDSELPLALNLPTADHLDGWDLGVRFTHRFQEQARSNGKDLYGLDGGAFTAFGLDLGIAAVPGLNAQLYRTADRKTFTMALQERFLSAERWSAALRVERFDEVIPGGRVGSTVQVPVDWRVGGGVVLSAVPTYLSSSETQRRVGTVGLGARWLFLEHHGLLGEYYPRPSKVDGAFERGFALGYQYRTLHHRFTLVATNELGTTAFDVLGGDYGGFGPSRPGSWNLGFNLVRVF